MTFPNPLQLSEFIQYSPAGLSSQVIFKDDNCQISLLCLPAGKEIAEHTASRNATVSVLEGSGILTLEGREIALEPGLLVFMPARALHALKAEENLAFLLTLSAAGTPK